MKQSLNVCTVDPYSMVTAMLYTDRIFLNPEAGNHWTTATCKKHSPSVSSPNHTCVINEEEVGRWNGKNTTKSKNAGSQPKSFRVKLTNAVKLTMCTIYSHQYIDRPPILVSSCLLHIALNHHLYYGQRLSCIVHTSQINISAMHSNLANIDFDNDIWNRRLHYA